MICIDKPCTSWDIQKKHKTCLFQMVFTYIYIITTGMHPQVAQRSCSPQNCSADRCIGSTDGVTTEGFSAVPAVPARGFHEDRPVTFHPFSDLLFKSRCSRPHRSGDFLVLKVQTFSGFTIFIPFEGCRI